jgi:hypothetical protein
MKKIILNIFIFFLISNCGFSPIYSKIGNQNFDIKIETIEGERLINNLIVSQLSRNKNDQSENKFYIDINTKYEKLINSKDATGATTNYQLTAISEIDIRNKNKNERMTISEKFIMDKDENTIDEKNYERAIKQIFASSITQKIIFRINSMK